MAVSVRGFVHVLGSMFSALSVRARIREREREKCKIICFVRNARFSTHEDATHSLNVIHVIFINNIIEIWIVFWGSLTSRHLTEIPIHRIRERDF